MAADRDKEFNSMSNVFLALVAPLSEHLIELMVVPDVIVSIVDWILLHLNKGQWSVSFSLLKLKLLDCCL